VRKFVTRQTGKLFPLVLLTLAFGLLQAKDKPDLNGTWKCDVTKSDFGPMPAPDSQTDKITHQEPSLKVNVSTSGQMGDMNYDLAYTTDGKESTNTIMGNEFKSTAQWEGDTLIINTKGSFNGTDITAKDRWTLSEDGKILTVQRHWSSDSGDGDQKIVYEKQ
jgi:hypothetical protein